MFYLPQVSSVVILSLIWLGNKYPAMPSIIVMQLLMRGGSTIVLISAALDKAGYSLSGRYRHDQQLSGLYS